jgi:hypothetical protein
MQGGKRRPSNHMPLPSPHKSMDNIDPATKQQSKISGKRRFTKDTARDIRASDGGPVAHPRNGDGFTRVPRNAGIFLRDGAATNSLGRGTEGSGRRSVTYLRNVENQNDGPIGIALVMVLAFRHDERLLFASGAEE